MEEAREEGGCGGWAGGLRGWGVLQRLLLVVLVAAHCLFVSCYWYILRPNSEATGHVTG